MDSLSAETVFVPPHRPLRLAQTRLRLLPGLIVLGVFVLLGLTLGPYADVAAVSGLRSARSVEHTIHGAVAVPNPIPTGATVPTQAVAHAPAPPAVGAPPDTDDSVVAVAAVAVATRVPGRRRDPSSASPARPQSRKGPLPPAYPGAHGGAGSGPGVARPKNHNHHDKQAHKGPGNASGEHGHRHGH